MNTLHASLGLAFGAALVLACGSRVSLPSDSSGATPAASHDVAKSSLARDVTPSVSVQAQKAFETANYAFASDMLGALRTNAADENLAYSPFSISIALSMPYAGAKGATASEMARALHWSSLTPAEVAKSFDAAMLALDQRADQAFQSAQSRGSASAQPDDFRLHVVNAVWADRLVTFQPAFLDTMAVDYGAGVTLADFVTNPEGERRSVNAWVSDETQGRIPDLLPTGSITTDTRIVLVDALHMKLPWAVALDLESTPKSFRRADGSAVSATYVHGLATLSYYEDANVQAVGVPLEGRSDTMLFVLPKGDLASFEATLTGDVLAGIRRGLADQDVSLEVPKFRFTSPSTPLKAALASLGLKTAFTTAADFSGIGRADGALFLHDVFHEATVGIDEKGLEAAAATAVVTWSADASVGGPPPPPPKFFHADRPFVFAIVDEPTSAVLFAGHVVDPTK